MSYKADNGVVTESNQRPTTAEAMNRVFEGQFRYRFLRAIWLPILVTVSAVAAPLLGNGFTRDALAPMGQGLMLAVVIWLYLAVALQRDILAGKYYRTADKLDEVLDHVDADAHWTWCEHTQSYAVHFDTSPHKSEAEETEKPSEVSEANTK